MKSFLTRVISKLTDAHEAFYLMHEEAAARHIREQRQRQSEREARKVETDPENFGYAAGWMGDIR